VAEFKKNYKKTLPYNSRHYRAFLFKESVLPVKWYAAGFKLDSEEETNLADFVEKYQPWFEQIILRFDPDSSWIINHDMSDLEWFPNEEDNLKSFRTLFKENNVPNSFKGALILSTNELLKISKDIISYPYAVFNEDGLFYMDIDISHHELPFIIKISDHLKIHFLSTNIGLLKKTVNKNISNDFEVITYFGTKL
jgi:hypothetical protein